MPRKRPTSINIVCAVGILGALTSIPIAFSEMASQIGAWYPLFLILSALIGLISMAGLWMMRRWGVIVYAVLLALVQVILIRSGLWNSTSVIGPGVVIAIAIFNFGAME